MEKIKKIIDKILGSPDKSSDEFLYFCPKCSHHKKKLSINYSKNKFKCWVCEYSGKSIYNLIKRYGDHDDLKDYHILTDSVSITDIQSLIFKKGAEEKRVTTCALPDEYQFILYSDHRIAKQAIDYLITRGLSEEDFYRWKIGFCESGHYAMRIIFPSFNSAGNCNFFIARGFLEDTKYTYLYSVIEKSDIIFNEINIDWEKPIYITEGIIDAIKIGRNSIPLIGKTISVNDKGYSRLIEKCIIYKPKIYLCLDSDVVKGNIINRSIKVADRLMAYGIEDISIIDAYPYKDFGEIPKEKINLFLDNKTKISNKFDIIEKQISLLGAV